MKLSHFNSFKGDGRRIADRSSQRMSLPPPSSSYKRSTLQRSPTPPKKIPCLGSNIGQGVHKLQRLESIVSVAPVDLEADQVRKEKLVAQKNSLLFSADKKSSFANETTIAGNETVSLAQIAELEDKI